MWSRPTLCLFKRKGSGWLLAFHFVAPCDVAPSVVKKLAGGEGGGACITRLKIPHGKEMLSSLSFSKRFLSSA